MPDTVEVPDKPKPQEETTFPAWGRDVVIGLVMLALIAGKVWIGGDPTEYMDALWYVCITALGTAGMKTKRK